MDHRTFFYKSNTHISLVSLFILLAIPVTVLFEMQQTNTTEHAAGIGQNPIQQENELIGTTSWQMTEPANNGEIQAYASADSITIGGSVKLYVSTAAPDTYRVDIYRSGWYHDIESAVRFVNLQRWNK